MAKHVLRILGPEGDIKHEWDDPASAEAQAAGRAFAQRQQTHQAVADVDGTGVQKPIREFNPAARDTTQFPRMQAGA